MYFLFFPVSCTIMLGKAVNIPLDKEKTELKEKACLVQEICAHHVAIELEKAAGSSEDRMLKESLMILSDRVIEEGKTIRTRVEYDLDLSDDFSFMDSFLNFETRTDLTEARAALDRWKAKYTDLIRGL